MRKVSVDRGTKLIAIREGVNSFASFRHHYSASVAVT